MPASRHRRPECLSADPVPGEQPRLLFQDADLVAVDKPVGWLTHPDQATGRPDVFTFLGGGLGVHQRLDVDTSGVLVFSRSPAGARLLASAFEGPGPGAEKQYLAVVDTPPPSRAGTLIGEVPAARGRAAETRYRVLRETRAGGFLVEAVPVTGRTHQIRAHLAAAGCPVRGDQRYGDPLDVRAPRLLLHCARLGLPGGRRFEAPAPPCFANALGDSSGLRAHLRQDADNTCYRELNGAGDACPGVYVDRYGAWLWVQHDADAPEVPLPAADGVYRIDALPDRSRGGQPPPRLVSGVAAPEPLGVRENGIEYRVVLGRHLSTGLFLDQRPQRAWVRRHVDGARVLNTFAHAGGFTVAAAVGGAARTVSIDLDRAWLNRIGPQLEANGLPADPARHDTIHGDVFDWVRRLAKRGETFDLVILDPPSTSVGARGRRWSAARDYTDLVRLVAPMVAPGGRLMTVTNHRGVSPARFYDVVSAGLPPESVLERVGAMPIDFPGLGSAPTKSWIWRRGP